MTQPEIDELTMTQLNGYIEQVQMLEYRRHYPLAVMIAQQGNFAGGRSTKKAKKQTDTVPYKPEDFMPYLWHANYKPYMELTSEKAKGEPKMGVDVETAQLIVSLNSREVGGKRASLLEPWMVAAFGPAWDEIVRAAEG
jgi:hypothetical protein